MRLFALALSFVLLSGSVRANESSNEETQISDRQDLEVISPEQVVILEEGIFYVDSQGHLIAAQALYSTSKGIVAKRRDEEKLCRGCRREITHNTCFNPGCDYYRIHQ